MDLFHFYIESVLDEEIKEEAFIVFQKLIAIFNEQNGEKNIKQQGSFVVQGSAVECKIDFVFMTKEKYQEKYPDFTDACFDWKNMCICLKYKGDASKLYPPFTHGYVHYKDFLKEGKMWERPVSMEKYYNDPHEFKATLHEGIVKIIYQVKNSFFKAKNYLIDNPDIAMRYMMRTIFGDEALRAMSPGLLKEAKQDIYPVWKKLREEYGR